MSTEESIKKRLESYLDFEYEGKLSDDHIMKSLVFFIHQEIQREHEKCKDIFENYDSAMWDFEERYNQMEEYEKNKK